MLRSSLSNILHGHVQSILLTTIICGFLISESLKPLSRPFLKFVFIYLGIQKKKKKKMDA